MAARRFGELNAGPGRPTFAVMIRSPIANAVVASMLFAAIASAALIFVS